MDVARDEVARILFGMRGLRVHVIGDAIRDVYTPAKCLGAASKSPTLVYELDRLKSYQWIGGAGIVAAHCRAAGADVTLRTAGETVKERIVVEGIKVAEFHDRPKLSTLPLDGERIDADIAIFADFRHGMFSDKTIASWMLYARDCLRAADSQTTDVSWGNILDFAGCDLLFANEREARFALRDQFSDVKKIGSKLAHAIGASAVFLKLGARGLAIYPGDRSRSPALHIPAFARQPIVDPIGAGDALLAYATMTYRTTKDLKQAGIVGSLAAAVACAHEGNVPVTPDEILELANESIG